MLWKVTKKVKCFAEPPDPAKPAIKVGPNRRGITFRAQELCVKVEVAVLVMK